MIIETEKILPCCRTPPAVFGSSAHTQADTQTKLAAFQRCQLQLVVTVCFASAVGGAHPTRASRDLLRGTLNP